MNRKVIYLIFGLVLLSVRLIFNYNSELIAGINGGYYPLQVRTLLETGHLGFSDMPLYFCLHAFFVKIASFFTKIDLDILIIHTSKIIDSISLSLLVFPLYLSAKSFLGNERPKTFEIILAGYATLSFSPLILTSDLQKNAFAIPLFLFFIFYLLLFLRNKKKRNIMLSVIFITLTGLTHFGVFSISVIILIFSLLVIYRKKAILPILGVLIFGVLMVFLFDRNRSESLLSLWNIIFEKPVILQCPLSPPDLFNFVFSYILVGFGIFYLVKREYELSSLQRKTLTVFYQLFLFSHSHYLTLNMQDGSVYFCLFRI